MERKFDEAHALRRTLLQKLNAQRGLSISSRALLFTDEPRVETRKAAAARFQELANHIVSCDRQELWRITALSINGEWQPRCPCLRWLICKRK